MCTGNRTEGSNPSLSATENPDEVLVDSFGDPSGARRDEQVRIRRFRSIISVFPSGVLRARFDAPGFIAAQVAGALAAAGTERVHPEVLQATREVRRRLKGVSPRQLTDEVAKDSTTSRRSQDSGYRADAVRGLALTAELANPAELGGVASPRATRTTLRH